MSREENMSKWTLKEKKCLLDTLQKLGCKNMTVLKNKFPKKTTEEIEAICNKYEQLAKIRKEERKKERPSIDAWIEIFRNIRNEKPGDLNITARVLKYLSLFQTNDDSEGIDPLTSQSIDPIIKKCYMWLAQAAQGREPDPIDDCSSCLLEQCLMHLMRATRIPNKDAKEYIRTLDTVPILGLFAENTSINPLDMPEEFLEIEEGEIKDLFDEHCVEK